MRLLGVLIALVLTLAAAAGGWLWWRFSVPAMEDEITPFNAYARSIQPEGDDGWPRYERFLRDRLGFDVLAARPWDAEAVQPFRAAQRQFGNLMAGELDDPRLAESLAAVREYGFVLPELDAVAEADAFGFQFRSLDVGPGTLSDVLSQALMLSSVSRSLCQLNAAHMRIASEGDDWDEVVRRFRTGVLFARRLSAPPLAVTRASGFGLEAVAWNELAWLLVERTPPRDALQMLSELVAELGNPLPWRDALIGERFGTRGFVRQHLLDTRAPLRVFNASSWRAWLETPSHLAFERAWRRFEDATLPVIDLPPAEREAKRKPTPRIIVESSMLGDPFDLLTNARDGLVRLRASVEILLHFNVAIAETGSLPDDPMACVPPSLRVDPLFGEPIKVDRSVATGRFPFSLRWPTMPSRSWKSEFLPAEHDLVYSERHPFEATEWTPVDD